MSESSNNKFECWAIVELFGHQQIAGLVTEATIGGCSFVRVDVPSVNDRPAFTKFYGNGAIYSMTPVGEKEAMVALAHIMPRPVSLYLLPEPEHVRDPEFAPPDIDDALIEDGEGRYDDDDYDDEDDDDALPPDA